MNPEAPEGADRRGVRRWLYRLGAMFAVLAIIFLLSNVALSSPWSRRWISGNISKTVGLAAEIAGASWSPWNGISLRELRISQPEPLREFVKEPLARVATIRLEPAWRAWFRGNLEIRTVVFDAPRFVVPLEILSHLATPPPAPAPPVAGPSPPPPVAAAAAAPAGPLNPPTAIVLPPAPVVNIPPPLPQIPRPTGWLRVNGGSFAIVHAGSQVTLLEISGMDAEIPISGNSARSTLKVGNVSIVGEKVAAGLAPQVDWTYPVLSLKPLEIQLGSQKLVVAAKLAHYSGIPLQLEAQFPTQPLSQVSLPLGASASAKSFSAHARFRGLLMAPITWQGEANGSADAPVLQTAGNETLFDQASAFALLRGGVLTCPDARLISDDLSVLGNATLLTDGRVAGALRWVAAPETASAIASRVFPLLQGPPSLTPLATPQRAAFDVDLIGTVSEWFVRLGQNGPVVNLKP